MARRPRRRKCRHCRRWNRGRNVHWLCSYCLERFRCQRCRVVVPGPRFFSWCVPCRDEYAAVRAALRAAFGIHKPDAATLTHRIEVYARRAADAFPMFDPIPFLSLLRAGPGNVTAGPNARQADRLAGAESGYLPTSSYAGPYRQIKSRRLDSFAEFCQANAGDDDPITRHERNPDDCQP